MIVYILPGAKDHMKKIYAGILVIFFLSFLRADSYGETKFSNSDLLIQDAGQDLKSNPVQIQKIPKVIPGSTQTVPPVMIQQPPSIPDLATTPASLPAPIPPIDKTTALKGPLDVKPVNIKVPDYEQQLQQMLQAQQPKVKKKKPLFNAILDEITNYGVFIILGLVAFILVYIVRKEKFDIKTQSTDGSDGSGDTSDTGEGEIPKEKRDIWDEKF